MTYRAGDVPPALPRDLTLGVYRVAQEALRNLARHAGVAECRVTLEADGAGLVLRVRDEGAGFDPGIVRAAPGLRLASMRERARLVGAALVIGSSPGRGTTVEVRAPLPEGGA